MSIEEEKRAAAELAAELVEPGMRVGLGTGSTVHYLMPALAERGLASFVVGGIEKGAGEATCEVVR